LSFPFLQSYLGLGQGLQTKNAAGGGGVGGWVELGRSTSATPSVASLANKRYYMILSHGILATVYPAYQMRINDDSGSNYSARRWDGASDTLLTNQDKVTSSPAYLGNGSANIGFSVQSWSNLSNKEKLGIHFGVYNDSSGAGTAPRRQKNVEKWANTSSSINKFSWIPDGYGTYTSDSEMIVLGYDPADTHSNNFWTELSSTTLTGSASTINSGTITAKKYLWIQLYAKQASSFSFEGHFNGDTSSNYSARYSGNGGADTTSTFTKFAGNFSGGGEYFLNAFVINVSNKEKLAIVHTSEMNASGAGTAPRRLEWVSKWVNTSSQITSIDFTKEAGMGDLQSGTALRVWGSD